MKEFGKLESIAGILVALIMVASTVIPSRLGLIPENASLAAPAYPGDTLALVEMPVPSFYTFSEDYLPPMVPLLDEEYSSTEEFVDLTDSIPAKTASLFRHSRRWIEDEQDYFRGAAPRASFTPRFGIVSW